MAINAEEGGAIEVEDALFDATEKLIAQGVIDAGDVKTLKTAGIRNFSGLTKHISENNGEVDGLSMAKLGQIIAASEIILEKRAQNQWKTSNTIERKANMGCYQRLLKTIEILTTSIALNSSGGGYRSAGQLAHWERELVSCKKKIENMERNNM